MTTPDLTHLLGQLPHCDASVLHAPGACRYCDDHPEWQALRQTWGIAYTGETPAPGSLPCPSDARRGQAPAHEWPGNAPAAPHALDACDCGAVLDEDRRLAGMLVMPGESAEDVAQRIAEARRRYVHRIEDQASAPAANPFLRTLAYLRDRYAHLPRTSTPTERAACWGGRRIGDSCALGRADERCTCTPWRRS